jgi:hypothetical protein
VQPFVLIGFWAYERGMRLGHERARNLFIPSNPASAEDSPIVPGTPSNPPSPTAGGHAGGGVGGTPLYGSQGADSAPGSLSNTSAGIGNYSPDVVIDVYIGPAVLLGSLALFLLSLFLLRQAVRLQLWANRDEGDVPPLGSGTALTIIFGLITIFVWFAYWINIHGVFPLAFSKEGFLGDLIMNLVYVIAWYPFEFALMFVVIGIPPAVIALLKFTMVSSVLKFRNANANEDDHISSPGSALVGAMFSLLNLLGSVASLVGLYVTLHP